MSTIPFVKLWPGGNTTALVEKKILRSGYFKIARKILAENKDVEQVGFLEKPASSLADIHLQMMGGEFCGNASRATAFFWSMKTRKKSLKLEVSGFPGILKADIVKDQVKLELPGSFFVKIAEENYHSAKIKIIDLMGIRFVIKNSIKSLNEAQKLIEKYKGNFPAVGVLYTKNSTGKIYIDPIVWVRETNTCYNETACGSGSIAATIAGYFKNPTRKIFSIIQPSKKSYTITLKTTKNKIISITFKGMVKYLGEKTINFSR